MKKKNYFRIIPFCIWIFLIAFQICANASRVVTMYSERGDTINIYDYEVESYKRVGWYTTPVKRLYAPNGSSMICGTDAVYNQLQVGWYEFPVTSVYSYDGRAMVIAQSEVESYKNVGWYTEDQKVPMYAPDGRIITVFPWDKAIYQNVGWYDYPVMTIYAADGRTMVISTDALYDYKNVGWFEYPVMTLYGLDNAVMVIATADFDDWVYYDLQYAEWWPEPICKMYSATGECMVSTVSQVKANQSVGWSLTKIKSDSQVKYGAWQYAVEYLRKHMKVPQSYQYNAYSEGDVYYDEIYNECCVVVYYSGLNSYGNRVYDCEEIRVGINKYGYYPE